MAQIFISYSHQDVAQASRIAVELEARGWSVWWDPEIRSGESFIVLINREISAASCVVVLWSKTSVNSRWVIEEAHNGLVRDILCPVMVDPDSQLPVGFATAKYIPLWEWRDGAPVGGFGPLIDELERIVGKPAKKAEAALSEPSEAKAPPAPAPAMEDEPAAPIRKPAQPVTAPPAAGARPQEAEALAERSRFVDLSDLHWFSYPVMGLLLIAFLMLTLSIVARFGLRLGLPALDELAVILLALAAFFGAAMAERTGRGIRSPVSVLIFPGGLRRGLALLHAAVSAALFGMMTYFMYFLALRSFRLGETTLMAGLPRAPVHAAVAVAFALLTLFSLAAIVRAFTRRSIQ